MLFPLIASGIFVLILRGWGGLLGKAGVAIPGAIVMYLVTGAGVLGVGVAVFHFFTLLSATTVLTKHGIMGKLLSPKFQVVTNVLIAQPIVQSAASACGIAFGQLLAYGKVSVGAMMLVAMVTVFHSLLQTAVMGAPENIRIFKQKSGDASGI